MRWGSGDLAKAAAIEFGCSLPNIGPIVHGDRGWMNKAFPLEVWSHRMEQYNSAR
jgi:hypothetical protein